MSETSVRTYELGYVLAPTVTESGLPGLVDSLKDAILKVEGSIVGEGNPEFIDLAYQMEKNIGSKKMKYSQGYFGWIKFDTSPEAMDSLKKVFDGMTEVIRYILIKTNVENTIVFKKPKIEAKRPSDTEGEFVLEESADDDLKEDHEMLPDVTDDVVSASNEEEPVEKESE